MSKEKTVSLSTLKISITAKALLIVLAQCLPGESFAKESPPLNPERYIQAITIFELRDQAFIPSDNAILFIGSSTITVWNSQLDKDLAPLSIIARGFGGSTIVDVNHYINRIVLPYKPRAIVIYEGDNDIAIYQHSAEHVVAGYQAFIDAVHSHLPKTRLYILSIKPSLARLASWPEQARANTLLKGMCDSHELLYFIDISSPMFDKKNILRKDLFVEDGVHMNSRGYDLLKDRLQATVVANEKRYE